ncbi:MAG: hypothetical protein KDE59_29825 [Anaerolineales bacterium]|nr:hypothetical protein [Anaerolineales bacterium]MCA9988556.1 hypothetical protein [Anaerolineales bacterium]MCB0011349.1 hypothetical protein [Anaerolineales bacterium]MCB8962998.1 hypothetical protein [Ardenticatenales bacterium]
MPTLIIIVVVALKFVLPVLYLYFPFGAGWANFVLDTVDGDILIPLGLADSVYQPIDKAADYVAYIFMLIWAWKRPIWREMTVVFVLRTIGQALFFITGLEIVFFYFPNLVEPLFLIYVSIGRFAGWDRVQAIYRKYIWLIWAFILVYKFQDEYFTHVANFDRSDALKRLFGW